MSNTTLIEVRRAKPSDAPAIAATHDDSWRAAYQGIIPGAELERLINRRGPDWWDSRHPQRQPGRDPRVRQFDRGLRQLRPQPRAQPLLRRRDLRALSAAGIPGPRLRPQAVLGGAPRPHPERLAEPRGVGAVGQRIRGRVLSLAGRPRGGALVGAVRHQGARQGRLRLERQRQGIIPPVIVTPVRNARATRAFTHVFDVLCAGIRAFGLRRRKKTQ